MAKNNKLRRKTIDLGGGYEVPLKPSVAQRMANSHRSVADAIAKTKVRGDCSRDLDAQLDDGPNEAFVVRDTQGVLPAKAKRT